MTSTKLQVTRIAAYGFILQEGKILLCRISSRTPLDSGFWTLPGGGIDFGEDPANAMVREVEEETGLVVQSRGLAGINSLYDEKKDRAFHGVRIIYHTEILGGEITYERDGSTDFCAWWSLEEATGLPLVDLTVAGLKLAFPNDSRVPSPD